MSRLTDHLAQQLLGRSPSDKERIGATIAAALGGDPRKSVSHLPPRRGNGDGGIDGRFDVLHGPERERRQAGLFVRIKSAKLSRDELYAFDGNLDREGLVAGVLVTHAGLGPDAAAEIARLDAERRRPLVHWTLAQILASDLDPGRILFVVDPREAVRDALRQFMQRRAA